MTTFKRRPKGSEAAGIGVARGRGSGRENGAEVGVCLNIRKEAPV